MSSPELRESVAETLVALQHGHHTGRLDVTAGAARARVLLFRGVPVFVRDGVLGDALGRMLLERSLLNDEQFAAVLRRQSESGGPFGAVCVTLGFLSVEQVDQMLLEQVRRKLLRCLAWEAVEQHFEPGKAGLEAIPHYPVEIEALLFEGVKKGYSAERIERFVAPLRSQFPLATAAANVIATRLRFKTGERQFVDGMDGTRSVEQLLGSAQIDAAHASQIFVTLLIAGVVVVGPEARSVTRELLQQQVNQVMGGEAPSLTEQGKGQLEAELAFRTGRQTLRAGELTQASAELARAHELHPEAVEYELYAAWVAFKLNKDPGAIAEHRQRLEQIVQRALGQDQKLAFAHYVGGHVALMNGDSVAAKKEFKLAMSLDATEPDAEKQYRVLSRRDRG